MGSGGGQGDQESRGHPTFSRDDSQPVDSEGRGAESGLDATSPAHANPACPTSDRCLRCGEVFRRGITIQLVKGGRAHFEYECPAVPLQGGGKK